MSDFIDAALDFPAVVFTFLLLVVVAYWLIVLTGLAELDDELPWLGLGGVPAGVTLSLLIPIAWFLSLAGGLLVSHTLLRVAVLAVALTGAWYITRLLVIPLRKLFPDGKQPSRVDFVGQSCVIRTGEVTGAFGQAEVTATDGSTAIIQVRTTGSDVLGRGETALIFEYDANGEFFYVMPFERQL
ncbi:hypothetical protein ACIBG7_17065 [Nonomuraea sp. NPDC050328]|uniref:hypothetical protein n=1 Tax=Nonomuraea sp. NPDC050328 TaxID=3364361 RepID=UPI0037B7A416